MQPTAHRMAAADGVELYRESWRPDGPTRAVVAVLHGIFEHCGRHRFLAENLARRGYAVEMMDLRGHGRSAGRRGSIRRFDQYLDDVDPLLDDVRATHPGRPIFLFGHSLGAEIAALYVVRLEESRGRGTKRPAGHSAPPVAGLILGSPYVLPGAGLFPWLRHLAGLLSVVCPRLRLVRMGCRNISRDLAVVEAYKNDPLVYHDRFEIRIAAEAMRAGKQIRRQAEQLRLPLLVIHGTGDLVAASAGSEELVARAGSSDKTLRLYEGLLHECLSEPEREQVLGDILAWLDQRTLHAPGV